MAVENCPSWFCIQINGQRLKGVKDAERFLTRLAKDIFEQDLHGVAVVGERFDDEMFESHSESYFFVRCSNYPCYVEKLKSNAVISRVLPNTENPDPVPEEQIKRFKLSSPINKVSLKEGDIVHVRRGYLENLVGIIHRFSGNGHASVGFRLYTRRFEETLQPSNLVLLGHVAEYLKDRRLNVNAH